MNGKTAVAIATIYLTFYAGLAAAGYAYPLLAALYLASLVVIIGMVYIVLKDESFKYPELAEGEEWGYRDKSKDELGLF